MTFERRPSAPAAVPRAPPLVRIEGVSKTFGTGPSAVRALDGVSLAIAANEFFTLLGPSGCGKTTLLRLLAGFEHPDAGTLLLDGRDVAADPPHRRPVNTVFQSYALFPHLSVAANVAFGLERLGRRGAAVRERVAAMLALVRLDGLADRRPDELSGGQQQRVALARALAPAPRLLLLDEPLSALDLKLRRGMRAELKRIQRESGIAFVLVTHDQEEALSLSDRLAVMEGGRVLQVGRPADVYARPDCRFVAEFLGDSNVLPGALLGLSSRFAAVRPERVALRTGPGAGLPGRAAEVTFLGPVTAVTVALDAGPTLRVARGDLPPDLAAGRVVRCLIPADAVLALER